MAIDYDQDITPLRRQYFPMLVGSRGFNQAMKYREEVTTPMQDRTMKLQNNLNSLRQQKLTFEKYQLDLRKQRDVMRKERDSLAMMPMIEERMREIRESGSPAVDQQEAFTSLAMENVGAINNSKNLSSLFTLQDNLLKNRASVEAKEAQKKQGWQSQLANTYTQTFMNTGEYREEVRSAILDGSIGGDEVTKMFSDFSKAHDLRTREQEAFKNARLAPVKEAEEAVDWVNTVTLIENERQVKDADGKEITISVQGLSRVDYGQLIRRFLNLKGLPQTPDDVAAIEQEYGLSADDPIRTLDALNTYANEGIIYPSIHGDSTKISPEGNAYAKRVAAAFGG